jgi:predicted acylesterase/phospholipase RssA/CRP-like cAMP-binding protein
VVSLTDDALVRALETSLGSAAHRLDLATIRTVEIDAGHLLCDAGDTASAAWVVVSGRLRASTVDAKGQESQVAVHGPGHFVGESALLEGGVRRARLRATRRTRLAELDRDWLTALLSDEPALALEILRVVLARQEHALASPAGVIGIVPLDSTVVADCRLLAEAAVSMGQRVLVDARAGAQLQHETTAGALDWIDQFEEEHGGVVLVGEPTRSEWTRAVCSTVDRLVFVVDARHDPAVGPFERVLLDTVPRAANTSRILVLVHPSDTDRPHETRRWLDSRDVDRHLHLRRQTPADTNRVARHLVGCALTVVIGAGGVRSAGAVGTLHALAERHIAVDAIAGVSGGSIVAGWFSMYPQLDRLDDKIEWAMRKLLDYTIPIGAVVAGGRAWARIQDSVGDRDISDTWLPLSVVTTDLTNGVPVNHVTGGLADRLYASISIPGVFPPVDLDGHLHIDGAVFDGLPVRAGRELVPDGLMVAVDVAPPHGRVTEPLPRVMRGSSLLLRRLIPGVRSRRVPNPLDTLMRSTTVASAGRRREALDAVDCHVHLNLSEFSVLDFSHVRQVIALGRAQSHAPLEAFVSGGLAPVLDPVLAHQAASTMTPATPVSDDEHGLRLASIAGSLSLAWADLRWRARRFVVAGLASSLVLALLLVMTGVVNQLYREPKATVAAFGGSHWIVPSGADGAFTSSVTFSEAEANGPDGIGRVLLARFRLADADGTSDVDAVLVGHADLPGAAPRLSDGRLAAAPDEVVVSDTTGYAIGDRVLIGPIEATVTGLADETTIFAGMPLLFVDLELARELVVEGEALLSAEVVNDVPDLPDSLQALDAAAIADDALGPIERPISTLRLVQLLLGVVATLIIGAVVFLATLDRLRDVAVLRAIGVASSVIGLGVAAQALLLGLLAALVALVIEVLLAPVFPLAVHIESLDRVILVVVSMLVATAASYVAIRRTLRTDPAEAFSGPGA